MVSIMVKTLNQMGTSYLSVAICSCCDQNVDALVFHFSFFSCGRMCFLVLCLANVSHSHLRENGVSPVDLNMYVYDC